MLIPIISGERTIPQKQHSYNKDKQEPQRKILLQIRNSIVQQFCLVRLTLNSISGYRDANNRSFPSASPSWHPYFITLLDNGQRHRSFSSGNGASHLFLRNNIHFAKFFQLHNAFPFTDINISHILRRTE